MREICIPVPYFGEDQIADVTLTTGGKKGNYSYMVESFPWSIDNGNTKSKPAGEFDHATPEQIATLRKFLRECDKRWVIVQIFSPRMESSHIQVLCLKINSQIAQNT